MKRLTNINELSNEYISELSKEYSIDELNGLMTLFDECGHSVNCSLSDLELSDLKELLNYDLTYCDDCLLFDFESDLDEYIAELVDECYLQDVSEFMKTYFDYDKFIHDVKINDYTIIKLSKCIFVAR